ncbi:MAG: hypothetical protein Q9214_000088 [Letrouitia sp. 1 TL-2023]
MAVLGPNLSTEQQRSLHIDDENTTWFGIVREDGELPLFQDYGRYANIMADTSASNVRSGSRWINNGRDVRYPSLVSFVGQTGAGKSTIIKLVVDLSTRQHETFATPVIGSKGLDVPTSGDVHLYSDPRTCASNYPILYADCEGLEGGERVPLGARLKKGARGVKVGRIGSFERKMQKMHHTSEREITWADTHAKRSREYAVTHLYPRLLYTFSDVVVFVLKNPRTIESVFEKLVNWAAAALEKSSNQPVLPHAIIVLNASENDIDPVSWNVSSATSGLFASFSSTGLQNDTFKKYAHFWSERNRRIETVEQLLHSYYSSVRVVRVPKEGRPNLIGEQIKILYETILDACASSRDRKGELRMLLDADELQPYLQTAFDHFACDLDTPFDFVQASFANSPIPLDFGGNILKLAISLMEAWENAIDGRTIFTELSYMVASCIMLDSARSKIRGTAEQIFPQYLEHVDAALENFCDRHWPCEYIKPGGGARCVNVRSGHGSKGHQLKNGKVLAVGGYVSRFSFKSYQENFQLDVYSRLDELLKTLRSRVQAGPETEVQAAAKIHKDTVMVHFYDHAARGRADAFISHSTCFSCLFEPPEHALPCGHIICTPCLHAYGRDVGRTMVEIDGCPLEIHSRPRYQVWKVFMKPAAAGIRILTLDGGGIRGIVELEILRQLERALGGRINIQCFFDLIVGTRYETRPLQEALISAYSEDEFLFGGPRPNTTYGPDVKVAVIATSAAGSAVVFANYNRLCTEKVPYQFQRPEKLSSELKVWEAARATSAAPRYFKPLWHGPSKQVYIDGGIYHNNPIQIADNERKLIWPSIRNDHPDIVLSIGTAYNPSTQNFREKESSPRSPLRGIFSHGKSLYKLAVDHISSTLDSEKTWEDYMRVLQPPSTYRPRFIRLNPKLTEDLPELDDVDRMREIQEVVRDMMGVDSKIETLAAQLVATTFYFEKSKIIELEPNGVECKGNILCRLPPDSMEIGELGRFMKDKVHIHRGHIPYFTIQEEHRGEQATRVFITPDIIDRMIQNHQFSMGRIDIKLSSKLATTEIFMCLSEGEYFPISRFPRSLCLDEDSGESRSRQQLAVNSIRWAGRTPSQSYRRKHWVAPDLSQRPQRADVISHYSDRSYVLGNSSQAYLQRSANLLTNGPGPSQEDMPIELPATDLVRVELPGFAPSELAGNTSNQPNTAGEMNVEKPRHLASEDLPSQVEQDQSSRSTGGRQLDNGGLHKNKNRQIVPRHAALLSKAQGLLIRRVYNT